eukprot:CAMPEP_0185552660 /NCGR_PEP_ID=MMETSP1381-20130426/34585_1 /TAXON_ID=298111 /ORGANISM="Pavlova sp., Strain CCMP459" /LENGTH=54 /DNA_ID=CAMNT_0028165663 /DNA_START=131 /DNA_END=295 /DNA_ORIENTATION=-
MACNRERSTCLPPSQCECHVDDAIDDRAPLPIPHAWRVIVRPAIWYDPDGEALQ